MRKNPFHKYLKEEDNLHIQVCNYLNYQYPNILYFHPHNEGRRTAYERYKFKLLGAKAGVPDIVILEAKKNYYGLFIELKSEKGKLTDNQENFIMELRYRNYYAAVCHNFEEAKKIIDWYFEKRY
jgi:hypothetical protein